MFDLGLITLDRLGCVDYNQLLLVFIVFDPNVALQRGINQ